VSSPAVPWKRLLTLKILQLHALMFYLHSLPYTNQTNWTKPQTSRLQHLGTDHVETSRFHCYSQTVGLLRICCLATGTCLPSRCPETVAVYRVTAYQRVCTPYYVTNMWGWDRLDCLSHEVKKRRIS
jgi:hypothetical protein